MYKKHLFLYREKDSDDRDRCAYIEDENYDERFHCNHYFGSINITGPCYSGSNPKPYEEVETVLTKEEYQQLWEISKEFDDLGYSIVKGDSRYKKGLTICKKLEKILRKLRSKKAQKFFADIVKEEKEKVSEAYNLTDEEVNTVFEEYDGDYRDSSIVSFVWDSCEEVAEDYVDECCEVDSFIKNYIDYNKIGSAMINDSERYLELSDGRIVEYNY